jgi:acyl-CoA synthetase (NDP forming)
MPDSPHPLDYIFHPQSVAVAGVSGRQRDWGGGEMFVRALQHMDFPGPIYPINPRVEEVLAFQDIAARAGSPVFWGVHRALHAVSRFLDRHEGRS